MPPHDRDGRPKRRTRSKAPFVFVAGDQIRAARRRRRLTIEELAEQADLTDRTIRRLEAAEVSKARRDTMEFIADALGVKLDALLAAAVDEAPEVEGRPATRKTSRAAVRPPAADPPVASAPSTRSHPTLDELADEEPPAPPPAAIKGAPPQTLTARGFRYVMAAFLGYEGVSFLVRGLLTRHRGLRRGDAAAVGSEPGAAVSFLVRMPTESGAPNDPRPPLHDRPRVDDGAAGEDGPRGRARGGGLGPEDAGVRRAALALDDEAPSVDVRGAEGGRDRGGGAVGGRCRSRTSRRDRRRETSRSVATPPRPPLRAGPRR